MNSFADPCRCTRMEVAKACGLMRHGRPYTGWIGFALQFTLGLVVETTRTGCVALAHLVSSAPPLIIVHRSSLPCNANTGPGDTVAANNSERDAVRTGLASRSHYRPPCSPEDQVVLFHPSTPFAFPPPTTPLYRCPSAC